MCTSKPKVDRPDPEAERRKAEAEAQINANADIAARKKTKRRNSLLASGAQGVTDEAQTSSVLAYGKQALGE